MSNIISLKDMSDVPGVLITMDSSKDCSIKVEYQEKVYISRSAETNYTIMKLRLKILSLMQLINIML